ncbi:hypothetical protein [Rudaeicoccus suwonensis]|uniref:hypothetical protein n=1 Tax=Rudaeicoccus suwonensis TaxID=657409 RepID=UPI0011A315B2|nr:hypothetical protein [Rudaeicoccus suwonensis]
MAACYVFWCFQGGRLQAGPEGLLHPVGAYWVTKTLQLRCIDAQTSASALSIQAYIGDDDRNPQIAVTLADRSRIVLKGKLQENIAYGAMPTQLDTTTILVPLTISYTGQNIYSGRKLLQYCP